MAMEGVGLIHTNFPKSKLVERPSSIADLAIKERNALDRDEGMTTAELTSAFETAVRDSGVFSWIGVVLNVEMNEGPLLDVYLSEREDRGSNGSAQETVADIVDLFDDLALSLEPNSASTLHMIRDTDLPTEKLEQEIRKLCTTSEAHLLLWQELL
ncbi:MAG TPA: hypothetical protein VJ183_10355 [Chloroflexia bacterium]|nr:hypothetical protein [Chloroflexia bacterium]